MSILHEKGVSTVRDDRGGSSARFMMNTAKGIHGVGVVRYSEETNHPNKRVPKEELW